MGKAWFYAPVPLPEPPRGWLRAPHPALFAFPGRLGRYEVRQAAYSLYPLWLIKRGEITTLPLAYHILDAFWIVEDYDFCPYEVTHAMVRVQPREKPMSEPQHPQIATEEAAAKITVRQYSMESIQILEDLRPMLEDADAKLSSLEDSIAFQERLHASEVIEARAGHRMVTTALRALCEAQKIMRDNAEDLP